MSDPTPLIVILWIAAIHNIGLFIFHLYNYYIYVGITEIKLLARLSLIAIFSIVVYQFLNAVTKTYETWTSSTIPCATNIWFISVCFIFSKLVTYGLIIERLFTLFMKTPFKFKPTCKIMTRSMLIIMFIIQTFLWIYYAEFEGTYTEYQDDQNRKNPNNEIYVFWCGQNYPSHILALLPLLDVIICILCSILFARRLIKFNIFLTRNNGKINQENVSWKIATKSTFLTFVALLSTPLCVTLVIFIHHVDILTSIDSMINCWCLMLMINTSNKIYDKLCLKMEKKIITTKCLFCYSCNCKKIRILNEDANNNNNNNSSNRTNNVERAITEITVQSRSTTGIEDQ